MNKILDRYSAYSSTSDGDFNELQSVRRGERIVYRVGLGCQVFVYTMFVAINVCMMLLAFELFRPLNPPMMVRYFAAFAGLVWILVVLFSFFYMVINRSMFYVDANTEEIVITPWPYQLPQKNATLQRLRTRDKFTIPFADVDYFLCCWDYGSSDTAEPQIGAALFAGLRTGSVVQLTSVLQKFEVAENLVIELGTVFNQQAFSVRYNTPVAGFIEEGTCGWECQENWEHLRKAVKVSVPKLREYALVMFDPADAR